MRSTILILILSSFAFASSAQVKSDVVGLSMGINANLNRLNKNELGMGRSFGAVYEHYFNHWFGLGTGIYHTRTSGIYIYQAYLLDRPSSIYSIRVSRQEYLHQVDLLEVPLELCLKLSGRHGKTTSWYFVPSYRYGLGTQKVYFEENGFYNVSSKEQLEFGDHNIHTIGFGTKVDFNIRNSFQLTLGGGINWMLYYQRSIFYDGSTNFNFYVRFGKLFMKKA